MIQTKIIKNFIQPELKNRSNSLALITGGTRGVGYEIVEKMMELLFSSVAHDEHSYANF